jgi:ABC-type transport system substrate-binding protein
MTDGPERNAIYLRMNKIVAGLTPWVFQDARVYSYVSNSYVYGYKQHPIYYSPFLFIDIRK